MLRPCQSRAQRRRGVAVGVRELFLRQIHCVGEVGPFEVRPLEDSLFEMREPEVGPFEMRVVEVGPFEVRAPEVGPFEMRASTAPSPSMPRSAPPSAKAMNWFPR
jgi:hypothetical protein